MNVTNSNKNKEIYLNNREMAVLIGKRIISLLNQFNLH